MNVCVSESAVVCGAQNLLLLFLSPSLSQQEQEKYQNLLRRILPKPTIPLKTDNKYSQGKTNHQRNCYSKNYL
jgi:hypothetical protein